MIGKILAAWFLCVGTIVAQTATAPATAAQGSLGATAATAAPAAATPREQITFEVASVRRSKPGVFGGHGFTPDGFDGNFQVSIYIGMAYGISNGFQTILGMPGWCKTEIYAIEAKVAEADIPEWQKPGSTAYQDALRALLEDRFKLKAHFETRDAPAYALVVAKGGSKFKAATPGETYPNGLHTGSGKIAYGVSRQSTIPNGPLIGQAGTMAQFVAFMNSAMNPALGRQVVDKTRLAGKYDFSMPMYAEWRSIFSASSDNSQGDASMPDSTPSIFTVIQESLGLKLVPTTVPVRYLVIDHIERPMPN